jgi:uncharacterized DUF497 family protein
VLSWDPKKRLSNIRKHGIDFAVAARVFEGVTLTAEDRRFPYGEQRFLTLGVINGVVVSIAHTESQHSIRIISIRKATRYETLQYYAQINL